MNKSRYRSGKKIGKKEMNRFASRSCVLDDGRKDKVWLWRVSYPRSSRDQSWRWKSRHFHLGDSWNPKGKDKIWRTRLAGKTKESKTKRGQLFSWLLKHSRKTFLRGRDGVEVVFKDFNLRCSSLPLFIFPQFSWNCLLNKELGNQSKLGIKSP